MNKEKDKEKEKVLLLEELEKLRCKDLPIIVEGKKDKICLNNLGFSKIFVLNGAIYAFSENFSKKHKKAIVLTDLDKEGKKLYSSLKENLEKNHVKIDNNFRNFLFKNTKIRQIEGIISYLN